MKRFLIALLLIFMIMVTFIGCARTGSVGISIDLSSLVESDAPNPSEITRAIITLRQKGQDIITRQLPISNNTAAGQIDDLAEGYWELNLQVFDGVAMIFTGDCEIEVLANIVRQYNLRIDPGDGESNIGSISFVLDINPMIGYKLIPQRVKAFAMDSVSGKLYILDVANKITAYHADTMSCERDYALEQTPSTIRLNWDNTALLVGYPSGIIDSLDIDTGESTQIADLAMPAGTILPFGEKYLLVSNAQNYSGMLKVWNNATGMVVDTENIANLTSSACALNPSINTAYLPGLNYLYRIRLNYDTGEMTVSSSGYSSQPGKAWVAFNDSRLIVSNGSILACSIYTEDLHYTGQFGNGIVDLVNDDTRGGLYYITEDPGRLYAMRHSGMSVNAYADLDGTPAFLFQTSDKIIVIVVDDGNYYTKIWTKAEFGF